MKIYVTGTRGIPDVPGGVEKHCRELYPRLVALGAEVVLCTRLPYIKDPRPECDGVVLEHCFAPRKKSLEAIVHTCLALLKARRHKPDIVHIHAVGPALLTPLARLLGYKVVMTNHGPDYDRQKWGRLARFALRLGEKLGGLCANEVIVISKGIGEIVRRRCHRTSVLIPNGVPRADLRPGTDRLNQFGLEEGGYVLAVARLVPEKGLHDLVHAFAQVRTERRLVIAGGADHESEYSRSLRDLAGRDPRVVMTGYQTGETLRQLYRNAGLFVLPSYHEGLPIVLLEALSFGLPVLVSDIPANREVPLAGRRYFRPGDTQTLAGLMAGELAGVPADAEETARLSALLDREYDWDRIAARTLELYTDLLRR